MSGGGAAAVLAQASRGLANDGIPTIHARRWTVLDEGMRHLRVTSVTTNVTLEFEPSAAR